MHKKILALSVAGLLLFSCSETEIIDTNPTETQIKNDPNLTSLGLKITADKSDANIFENIDFKLSQKNQSTYFGILADYLDVLTFKISNTEGEKIIFEKTQNGNSVTTSFNYHFYYQGNYTATIEGFKDGKKIYSDQTSINVSDNNDFLAVNWNGFTSTGTSVGYTNTLQKNTLGFYSGFENQHPFVTVTNMWDNMQSYSDSQIKQMDKEYLYNYLVKYYSNPTYSEGNGNTDLKSIYTQNFKKSIKNDIPVNIWITAKNKIALMKQHSATYPSSFYGYIITAEPNN
ncbi:hypothetical protein EG349_02945 [Chryseobacterium shandongense]|uniref:Uncharacterized protein n=1 Tax=Chryseobacterium shandongense TaxID=1493872 RepID=A0AAD1DK89_9FLAO|nr:hypothetical protein [Chryseobacterium shandongense]AZA85817.1 hypothetical protein EG349_02945 [Chryseobacterium shandongense]AZA94224.1 hypothetical protein EG353_00980 [Chryseobacterium shandongense]